MQTAHQPCHQLELARGPRNPAAKPVQPLARLGPTSRPEIKLGAHRVGWGGGHPDPRFSLAHPCEGPSPTQGEAGVQTGCGGRREAQGEAGQDGDCPWSRGRRPADPEGWRSGGTLHQARGHELPHQVPARTLLPRIGGEGELTIWEEGLSATHSLLQPPAPRRHAGGIWDRATRVPTAHPVLEDQRHFRLPLALVSPGTITAISTWGGLYYHCH